MRRQYLKEQLYCTYIRAQLCILLRFWFYLSCSCSFCSHRVETLESFNPTTPPHPTHPHRATVRCQQCRVCSDSISPQRSGKGNPERDRVIYITSSLRHVQTIWKLDLIKGWMRAPPRDRSKPKRPRCQSDIAIWTGNLGCQLGTCNSLVTHR